MTGWTSSDVSRPEECDALVAAAVAEFGRLDVLVNMASVYRAVPFDRMTADDFQAARDVDLKAAFLCARAVVPHMKAGGGGRIVNIADWLAASHRPRSSSRTSSPGRPSAWTADGTSDSSRLRGSLEP